MVGPLGVFSDTPMILRKSNKNSDCEVFPSRGDFLIFLLGGTYGILGHFRNRPDKKQT